MAGRSKWDKLTDEELLDVRLCDLSLRIKGTPLEGRLQRLYAEIKQKNLRFRPHVWLSEEWFTPDGVPGFAIPFYLAHPRLMKLERRQMLQVEGGSEAECLRIMRHEAAHALDNAFYLHTRRRWRELFGPFSAPYPESYRPRPNSRDYVLHLNAWYAQAHPAEDFAETFAVWLTPGSRWRRRYADWPALHKLEYVDQVMNEIAGRQPKNKSLEKVEELSEIKSTLREHYNRKREYYSVAWPAFYDRDLRRIFSSDPEHSALPTAASFLRRHRRNLRDVVAEGTGVHRYTVDYLLKDMTERARSIRLRLSSDDERLVLDRAIVLLTAQTMNVIHSGYQRIAL